MRMPNAPSCGASGAATALPGLLAAGLAQAGAHRHGPRGVRQRREPRGACRRRQAPHPPLRPLASCGARVGSKLAGLDLPLNLGSMQCELPRPQRSLPHLVVPRLIAAHHALQQRLRVPEPADVQGACGRCGRGPWSGAGDTRGKHCSRQQLCAAARAENRLKRPRWPTHPRITTPCRCASDRAAGRHVARGTACPARRAQRGMARAPGRDALRPLMHVQRGADAMPRAVPIVQAHGPQRGACQHVNGAPRGALGPHGGVQPNVALQDGTGARRGPRLLR